MSLRNFMNMVTVLYAVKVVIPIIVRALFVWKADRLRKRSDAGIFLQKI